MNFQTVNFQKKHQKNRKGFFFVVSGPSAVGKNTLLNEALKNVKDVYYLPSITTREMRAGEKQGWPYFFVSNKEFERMIADNEFLEWKRLHTGSYYGTHLPTITFALDNGFDIVTDMDVLGCAEVMKKFPDNIISIFVQPPDLNELHRRLCNRDDNPQEIETRMRRVEMEMSYAPNYHYRILNDNLGKASLELVNILNNYSSK